MKALGHYEIEGVAGKGATGIVYRAYDRDNRRTVALKTIRTDAHSARHDQMLEQLRNEGRSAGIFSHPNIVSIYESGEIAGLFYLAMEFVEGETLAQVLAREPKPPIENVISLAAQVCAGLGYAHSKNVIHRDIKPANIMIGNSAAFASISNTLFQAKITDFGIANTHGTVAVTQHLGTPHYMSPEHVRGGVLDGRSDLFSLGIILHEMLTGKKPFDGDSVTSIIYKIVHDNPVPPHEIDSRINPGLSGIVSKALAKRPVARFQSGAEFSEALQNYTACKLNKTAG